MKITRWNSTDPIADLRERANASKRYASRHRTAIACLHSGDTKTLALLRRGLANEVRREAAMNRAADRMEREAGA